jgi:hypothetical protein
MVGKQRPQSVVIHPWLNQDRSRDAHSRHSAANGGNINVNADVATVTFASEWKDSNGLPFTPAIVGSSGLFASASSSTGFTLQVSALILANTFADFSLIVSGG